MLYLRPDTKLGRVKRIALHAITRHTHTAEIILVDCYGRTGKAKVPGFQTGLRKGNVTAHTLGLAFGEV